MIVQVRTAQQKAQFLAAAEGCIATKTQMGMRLALFAELPGSGWQFYLNAPQENAQSAALAPPFVPNASEDFALALRGASASVAGVFDPEEMGSFLSFLGVDTVTTTQALPPQGYALHQTLTIYTLAQGQQLVPPAFTGAMTGKEQTVQLMREPSVAAILPLLWGEDPTMDPAQCAAMQAMQEQYYSDNCTARNHGMAAFWLVAEGGVNLFTVSASAIVDGAVYLSAGETIPAYRGQGIGGYFIVKMANEYAKQGNTVCFVCEAVRCRFYDRLGFARTGRLYQHRKNASDLPE